MSTQLEPVPGTQHDRRVVVLKVARSSRPSALAGAIAGVIREGAIAEVQAIGAAAVNQAVKAIALASRYLEGDAIQIAFVPLFADVAIGGEERTAIRLVVSPRDPALAVQR
ncbi:MAG: stage V sporulation protein S [Chloroflexi bacterium OHK40]